MNDAQLRAANAEPENDMLLAARLIELWRVCGKVACKRARACRGDPRQCCEALVDWSETLSMKDKSLSFREAIERLRSGSSAQ